MARTAERPVEDGGDPAPRRRVADRIAERRRSSGGKSSGVRGWVVRIVMLALIAGGVAGGLWWLRLEKMKGALQSLSVFSIPKTPDTRFGALSAADRHLLRQAATLGERFIPRLAESYPGSTKGGKFGIIYCLGLISGRAAQEFLIAELERTPAAPESRAAALCLGGIGGPGVRLKITSWAKSGDVDLGELAILAARASSDRDREEALRALDPIRKSTEPRLQLAMLAALHSLPFDSRGTAEYMVDLLVDGDENVSGIAYKSLRRHIGDLKAHRKFRDLRKDIHRRGVNHRNYHVQLHTRRIMRFLGGPDIQRTSRKDLQSTNVELVREAAITLHEMGDNPAVRVLIDALRRSEPEATRELAVAIGGLAKVSGRSVRSEHLEALRALAADGGLRGAGACYALGLLNDDPSLKLIHSSFVGAKDDKCIELTHDALVELAGEDKGPGPADWKEWWARNEKIFELRRDVLEAIEAAKAIGATGRRKRYPEAKKILRGAQEKLFQLEELEGRRYTRLQTEVGSMLDGLHKHTIINIEDDEDLWEEEEKEDGAEEDGDEEG